MSFLLFFNSNCSLFSELFIHLRPPYMTFWIFWVFVFGCFMDIFRYLKLLKMSLLIFINLNYSLFDMSMYLSDTVVRCKLKSLANILNNLVPLLFKQMKKIPSGPAAVCNDRPSQTFCIGSQSGSSLAFQLCPLWPCIRQGWRVFSRTFLFV